jgi:lipopolysaccharide heptosyltransferase II
VEPITRLIVPEWQSAHRILCVRLDTLGDVLMTTPAIRALKESLPESCITLLTSPAGAGPAPYIPEIDNVLVYEAPWLKASPFRPDSQIDRVVLDSLRGQFDAAVIFTVYSQNPLPAALFCYLADIPLRLAYCRENPYKLLTHWVKETEPEQTIRHEVRRQLDLVATIGVSTENEQLSFWVPAQARECITARLKASGLDLSHPWIALHPGVTAPSRQYAPERYAQVAHQLAAEDGLQIVFTGSPNEVELVERIRGWMEAPSISMAGQLSIAELAALLQQAALLLSNNTGPVHLAAAVGTPVVVLYALTNPQHTPWEIPSRVLFHDVPCKYCYKSTCPLGHHHCLELVSTEQVVQAVRSLLAETVTRQPGV